MPESVQTNNITPLKIKSTDSEASILTQKLLLTPPVLLTLNEKVLKPYWNQHCQELQSNLWLPHRTELPVQASNSSKDSSNYQAVKLNSLMTRLSPKISTQPNSLPLSPLSVILTTENVQPKPENVTVKAVKKIRIYPENTHKYQQMNAAFRRAYNLTVEMLNNGKYLDEKGKSIDLRPAIREQVKKECQETGQVYDVNVIQQAVKLAKTCFIAVCRKNSKKEAISTLKFKSRKEKIQSFSLDRLPKSFMPCIKSLGRVFITESIPEEATGKEVTITCDHGRWFMAVQQHISLKTESQGQMKCVAIDPGVRTFSTCYSAEDVLIAGKDFAVKKLLPLAKKMRKLLSLKKKLSLQDSEKQWVQDRLLYCEKQLNYLECERQDKIKDLHHKLAYELVCRYDVVFLPSFETSKMSYKNKRSLTRKTAFPETLPV